MNESRTATLVYSVTSLIIGVSLAGQIGDAVAAGLLFAAAVLSWVQWTVLDYMTRKIELVTSLKRLTVWRTLTYGIYVIFGLSVAFAGWAVVRILLGLLS